MTRWFVAMDFPVPVSRVPSALVLSSLRGRGGAGGRRPERYVSYHSRDKTPTRGPGNRRSHLSRRLRPSGASKASETPSYGPKGSQTFGGTSQSLGACVNG